MSTKFQWVISTRTAILPDEEQPIAPPPLRPVMIGSDCYEQFVGTRNLIISLWDEIITEDMYALFDAVHERHVFDLVNFGVCHFRGVQLSSNQTSLVMANMENNFFGSLLARRKWNI